MMMMGKNTRVLFPWPANSYSFSPAAVAGCVMMMIAIVTIKAMNIYLSLHR